MLKDREEQLNESIEYMFALEPVHELALVAEAEAEYGYETRFADEFNKAVGAMDLRKELATLAAGRELEAHLKAKATAKHIAIRMKNAQTAVEAKRSLLSSERQRASAT